MPNKQKQYSETYLKFLQLVQSLRNLPDFVLLDPVEERLLHLFATVWQAGQPDLLRRVLHQAGGVG